VALSAVSQFLDSPAHPVYPLADALYDRLLLHLGKLSLRSVVALRVLSDRLQTLVGVRPIKRLFSSPGCDPLLYKRFDAPYEQAEATDDAEQHGDE
jgi:hypothetical protein